MNTVASNSHQVYQTSLDSVLHRFNFHDFSEIIDDVCISAPEGIQQICFCIDLENHTNYQRSTVIKHNLPIKSKYANAHILATIKQQVEMSFSNLRTKGKTKLVFDLEDYVSGDTLFVKVQAK